VTGLRPGEKLAEELSTPNEGAHATEHPKIVELNPPLLDEAELATSVHDLGEAVRRRDNDDIRRLIFDVALREPTVALDGVHGPMDVVST
jgi:FlaA1/EpsC-like NDP-sugar epimerase